MATEPENGPDPVTPMLTNYSIQCHSNFAARDLQRPNMLTPSPETASPAAIADPYFSLTDIPRRAQATKNLASRHFQHFMFST